MESVSKKNLLPLGDVESDVQSIFVFGGGVPRESLLVKGDDHLRTFDVGLPRRNQICLVAVLPLKNKINIVKDRDHFD